MGTPANEPLTWLLVFCLCAPQVRAAGPDPLSRLTPAERAFVEVFLLPRSQYRTYETPLTLAGNERNTADWGSQLTEESYDRISAAVPGFAQIVRQGREYRERRLGEIRETTYETLHRRYFPIRLARELRESFQRLILLCRQRRTRPQDPLLLNRLAETLTRVRYGIAENVPQGQWDREASRYFLSRLNWLEQEPNPNGEPELPKRVVTQWVANARARLSTALQGVRLLSHEKDSYPYEYTFPSFEGRTLAHSLSGAVSEVLGGLSAVLEISNSPSTDTLLRQLEEADARESRSSRNAEREAFGEGAFVGGRSTPLVSGRPQWLLDVGWWGLSRDPYYWYNLCNDARWRRSVSWLLDRERYWRDFRQGAIDGLKVTGVVTGILSAALGVGLAGVLGAKLFLGIHGGGALINIDHNGPVAIHRDSHAPSSNPTTQAQREMVDFRIRPFGARRLTDLPMELIMAKAEHRESAVPYAPRVRGAPSFEVSTGMEHEQSSGMVSLPYVPGYDLVPEVRSGGRRLVPGTDYTLHRSREGTIFLRLLPGAPSGTVSYIANYYPTDTAPPPEAPLLTDFEKTQLQVAARSARGNGFTAIAEGLEELAMKSVVSVRDIETLVRERSRYSTLSAYRDNHVNPNDPFRAFLSFRDREGRLCADCDVVNDFLRHLLRMVLLDHRDVRVESSTLVLRDPDRAEFTRDSWHGRLNLWVGRHPGPLVLDATPHEMDPRDPTAREHFNRLYPRRSQGPVVSSLTQLPHNPAYHRYRNPGQLPDGFRRDEIPDEPAPPPPESETPAAQEARIAAERELSEREARDRARQEQLRILRERRGRLQTALEARITREELPHANAQYPHQIALEVARRIGEYLEAAGTIPEEDFRRHLRTLLPEGTPAGSIQGLLAELRGRLQGRVDQMRARLGPDGGGPHARFLNEGLVRPALDLIGYAGSVAWTPFEVRPRPSCPEALARAQ